MKIEDKLKRIKELDRVTYPTHEQIEERLKLDEEIEIELRDNGIKLDQYKNQEDEQTQKAYYDQIKKEEPKKKKQTIFEKFIKPRLQGKKATWDDIQQLKLEAMKAKLEMHIAEAKARKRQLKTDRLNSILSMVTGGRNESSTKKKKKLDNGSSRDDDDLRDLIGSNDPTKYDKLFKK